MVEGVEVINGMLSSREQVVNYLKGANQRKVRMKGVCIHCGKLHRATLTRSGDMYYKRLGLCRCMAESVKNYENKHFK